MYEKSSKSNQSIRLSGFLSARYLFFFFVFSPSLLFCPPLVEFNFSLEKGVKNYSKMVSSNNRGRFNKIFR